MTVKIMVSSIDNFFKRGKRVARLADQGSPIPRSFSISFEDPKDFSTLVSPAKLALIAAVREKPSSITDLAKKLNRDRSAVKRDVSMLETYGLVSVEEKINPGHGISKEVKATSKKIQFFF